MWCCDVTNVTGDVSVQTSYLYANVYAHNLLNTCEAGALASGDLMGKFTQT